MTEEKTEESKVLEMINRAEVAVKRLEEENKKAEILLTRKALAGESEAGTSPPPQKEETAQEYAARVLKGRI